VAAFIAANVQGPRSTPIRGRRARLVPGG
jgi:hypothetical protein